MNEDVNHLNIKKYAIPVSPDYYYFITEDGILYKSIEENIVGICTSVETVAEPENINIYPNPSSTVAHINFDNPSSGKLKLSIIDMNGDFIKQLPEQFYSEGTHNFDLNLSDMNSGVYFIAIEINKLRYMKKLVIQN